MKNRHYDRLACTVAAALLLGVSSTAFAQAPATTYGQNSTSYENSKNQAKHRLQDMGFTNIKLKKLKHGWNGTAMKDGQPVKVELTQSGEVRTK
jgi:Spy/CpxP family protein refolding chaperone